MRAATLTGPGVVDVREFATPLPAPDEVLVEMRYASICGSDVHVVFDGFHRPELLGRPGYPGHEGVGTVCESVPGFPAGTPVLTVPRGTHGGCFAEYQAVQITQLIPLPPTADPRRLLLAQQLGTTVFALASFLPAGSPPPERVVVLGAGSAGLFFVQLLRRRGVSDVIVVEPDPDRRDLAVRLGADVAVGTEPGAAAELVAERSRGAGADLVIEAAGPDAARAVATELIRTGGTVGVFGYPEHPGLSPFPVQLAFRKSAIVRWISGAQSEPGLRSFRAALDLIGAGNIEVDHCLTAVYPLGQTAVALRAARDHLPGAPKITIDLRAGR